jgi:hypothetical protein
MWLLLTHSADLSEAKREKTRKYLKNGPGFAVPEFNILFPRTVYNKYESLTVTQNLRPEFSNSRISYLWFRLTTGHITHLTRAPSVLREVTSVRPSACLVSMTTNGFRLSLVLEIWVFIFRACSSETSPHCQNATERNNPKNHRLYSHCRENLKSNVWYCKFA